MTGAAWLGLGLVVGSLLTAVGIALARAADDPRDDFVCCRCADNGVVVTRWPDGRPRKTWCDCLLGRTYRTAANRPRPLRSTD